MELFHWLRDRRERCWRRILQQKLFNSLSGWLETEFYFLHCISWIKEQDCRVFGDVVFAPELLFGIVNDLFQLSGEEVFTESDGIVSDISGIS